MVIDLSIENMPFAPSFRQVSAYSVDASVSEISVQDDKISAAKAAIDAKRYALALNLFEEVLESEPSRMDSISKDYVMALHSQASSIVDLEPEAAKSMLLMALDIDTQNVPCLTQLGYVYLKQNDHPNAIKTYNKVASIKPRFAGAFFNLGYLYWITEDYAQAKDMYLHVIDLKPKFLDEALFNLAMIHAKLGERDACVKSLEQAIAINPQNESARKYLQQFKGGSKSSDES